jgi:hypothetical protein
MHSRSRPVAGDRMVERRINGEVERALDRAVSSRTTCMCGLIRANDVQCGSQDAGRKLGEPGAEIEVRGDCSASPAKLSLARWREVYL